MSQQNNLHLLYKHPPQNFPPSRYKTHGLSQTPSVSQILSYILVIGQIVIYFICVNKLYFSLGLMIVFGVSGLVMIVLGLVITLDNPTDWITYYYKKTEVQRTKFKFDFKLLRFCTNCQSYCSKDSKHCRQCNRCVQHFDHHCKWFNNCVGKNNYKYFFASICVVFVHLSIYIAHVILVTISVIQTQQINQNIAILTIQWIMGCILLIFDILIINLIVLHIYLMIEGITTYQLLTKQKCKKIDVFKQSTNKIQTKINLNTLQQKKQTYINSTDKNSKQLYKNISASRQIKLLDQNQQKKQNDKIAEQNSYTNLNSYVIQIKQRNKQDDKLQTNQISQQRLIEVNNKTKIDKLYKIDRPNKLLPIKQSNLKNSYQSHLEQTKIQDFNQYGQNQTIKSANAQKQDLQSIHSKASQSLYKDQIIENQNQQKVPNKTKNKMSQKTIKKRSRMKTFVAYTKNEDEKNQPNEIGPNSQQNKFNKESMMRSYFRQNRSLRFIINGNKDQASSPMKLPHNHRLSQQQQQQSSSIIQPTFSQQNINKHIGFFDLKQ